MTRATTEAEHRLDLMHQLYDSTFRLMRMTQQEAVRLFEPLGLRPVKAFVLELLAEQAHYPKEIAMLLDAPPSVISVLLGDLEDRGLLSRSVDPDDRRRMMLELTADGHRMVGRVREAWRAANDERLSRLSTADLEALTRIQNALLE